MSRRVLILVSLLLIASTACNRPLRKNFVSTATLPQNKGPAQTGSFDGELTSNGVSRHFCLHVPQDYQADTSFPLIVNFHGYGSNSLEEEKLTGMSVKADTAGFIVVYPDGLNNAWNDGPGANGKADLQFIRDLISYIESQYNIDPKRIYATGISNGGGMTNRLGCDMADLIAAIAPDSGAYNLWENCSPSRPMPVLAFHGLNDNVVPYEGGNQRIMEPPIEDWAASWARRNGCSSTPETTNPEEDVTVRTWSNCQDHADVILYALANHGHSWPGSLTMPKSITSQAVNATDVIWDFFVAHPMP